MNVQSYGYMQQQSPDIRDVRNDLVASGGESLITLSNSVRTGIHSLSVERFNKLQRRSSGKMTRPLGLTPQKGAESKKLSSMDKNLSSTIDGVGGLQRSESFISTKFAGNGDHYVTEIPQKSRIRRVSSLNSPRLVGVTNKNTLGNNSGNIQMLAIDNSASQSPMSLRQNSDLQNPYKKVVPKPQRHKHLNHGGTNSTSNFTESIEFFNVESFPVNKGNEIDVLLSSKSVDSNVFTSSKALQLVAQSNMIAPENCNGTAQETGPVSLNPTNPSPEVQVNFVKSVDTIRLSAVTFEQTDSQLLSSQYTFVDSSQPIDNEHSHATQGRKVVYSLSVGPKTLHRFVHVSAFFLLLMSPV